MTVQQLAPTERSRILVPTSGARTEALLIAA